MTTSPIIVALDFHEKNSAYAFIDRISPKDCRLKIGKGMFTQLGPQFVRDVQQKGFDVFLDLKFHDIPNTVASAVKASADLGVWMVDIHASGGSRMMEAAKNALLAYGNEAPKLIAVTVLTSMNNDDLHELGIADSAEIQAQRLAILAKRCGMDGIVCSAQEVTHFRHTLDPNFLLVTPGIRPSGAAQDDQRRIMTPQQAISTGVNYMVIGRPITQAPDPSAALVDILHSIQ